MPAAQNRLYERRGTLRGFNPKLPRRYLNGFQKSKNTRIDIQIKVLRNFEPALSLPFGYILISTDFSFSLVK